jgi:hypothetical protein
MKWRYFAGIAAVLLGASAFAGLINQGLSAEEAQQIKRFAIVSGLGDVIHGRLFGLTRFQSKNFDMAVPGWGLDAMVAKALKERIVAGAKISGEVAVLSIPPSKKSAILSEAQAQGFDAVLVVIAEPSVPDPALIGGVMLVREKRLGVDRIYPCAGIVMRVWRVSDGKQIGFTTPKPCGLNLRSPVWHDRWDEFSDEEKQSALTSLQDFLIERMNSSLIQLKLSGK